MAEVVSSVKATMVAICKPKVHVSRLDRQWTAGLRLLRGSIMKKVTIGFAKRNKNRPYIVRWYGDCDSETGKQKRYGQSFRLKAEAEAYAAEKTVEFAKGSKRDRPDQVTLRDFCEDWLKVRKPELRPASATHYKDTIRYLSGYFGADYLLSKVTLHSAEAFISQLTPLSNKEQLSPWTKSRILRNCKTMFKSAVLWEIIPKNPFEYIKRPKCINKPWHYLTPTEYNRLLEVAPTPRWKALYAVAYTAGLRLGELYSLTWDSIDFEGGKVKVENRPGTATMPEFYIKDSEAREIPLPQATLDILSDLKTYNIMTDQSSFILLDERAEKAVLAKWKKYRGENRPWLNRNMVNNTLREFRRHTQKADIKPKGSLTVHTLRKSCITNWANTVNNPEAVRVWAGHADLKTTMRFYSQVTEEQAAEMADKIDSLVRE